MRSVRGTRSTGHELDRIAGTAWTSADAGERNNCVEESGIWRSIWLGRYPITLIYGTSGLAAIESF